MPAESAGLAEAFSAHLAHEGPGPGVHRHVPGQVVVRVKNLHKERKEKNKNNPAINTKHKIILDGKKRSVEFCVRVCVCVCGGGGVVFCFLFKEL